MEYVFGTKGRMEILRTKGDAHTDLTGQQETVREFPVETITDRYQIIRKIDSQEDPVGNCYDWYEIDRHFREIDKSPAVRTALSRNAANIDYVAMMAGVDLPEEGGAGNGTQL